MQDFTLLKRRQTPAVLKKAAQGNAPPLFRLMFDDNGAYIQSINKKRQEIFPDYRSITGHARNIVRTMDTIRSRQELQMDWAETDSRDSSRIYMEEHDYLVDMLRSHVDLMDEKGREIRFASNPALFELYVPEIQQKKGGKRKKRIQCTLRLMSGGREIASGKEKIKLVSERFVLAENTIYEVDPLGDNYRALPLFHTRIAAEDLLNCLSLACSAFHDLKLQYEDYGIRHGQPAVAGLCIIFEDVDVFNALRLSVSSTLPGFHPEFLRDYDINRIVEINELERKLVIRDVVEERTDFGIRYVRNALNRHRKRMGKGDGVDFFQDGNVFIIESGLAGAFLFSELESMIERFTLIGTEKLKSYKIRPAATPSLSLKLQHNIDFLEGEGTIEIEGQEFNLVDMLRHYRKKGYVKLSDGTSVILEKGYIQRLQRIFDPEGEKVRVSFFDLPIVEELIDEKTASASFPEAREIFLGFNKIASTRPHMPDIRGTLRPYQKYGFKWLRYLHKHRLGACLADDMGLGKTIQAITLLASVKGTSDRPSLIVMPRTLLFNWGNELKRFAPQLTFYTWHGQNRDMKKACEHDIILTTYGLLRTGIEQFREQRFFYVILDESQAIKNLKSQTSKAVMLLDCEHRLALSGTPIENNLGELYSLFRFLNPGMFRNEQEFARRYGDPIQHHNDETAIRELQKKIYPFILRRLKQDVLKDLPDKVEQTLYVEMDEEQKRLYEERRLFYKEAITHQIASQGIEKSQFFILQAMLELRQIASCPEARSDGDIISPKRELLIEQVQEAIGNRHKILIFANFLSVIESVTADLEDAGIPYLSMTGATRNRQELVEQFQNDPGIKVFVMTLKTGGVGLNLTAADTIFIFDPWWNVSAENQAIDRTHRIGQTRSVLCYRLICRNSIEEKMMELQEKKRKLFDAIISSDSGAVKRMTEEDIEFMLA